MFYCAATYARDVGRLVDLHGLVLSRASRGRESAEGREGERGEERSRRVGRGSQGRGAECLGDSERIVSRLLRREGGGEGGLCVWERGSRVGRGAVSLPVCEFDSSSLENLFDVVTIHIDLLTLLMFYK